MKIAILADTHWGARSDNHVFLNYFSRFFDDVFFPYLRENNIKHVIHLGDVFDRRKYINFRTLQVAKQKMFDPMVKDGITMYAIVGNHDVAYRNSNELNSPEQLLGGYPNVHVFTEPGEIFIGDFAFGMLPWINRENEESSMQFLANTKAQVLCAHLELQGFQLHRGVVCDHGTDPAVFDKFDMVFTGHFHQKHDNGRVFYLGTPYQITFADLMERKGFHVFDTETRNLEFITNPYKMFHRIEYDDSKGEFDPSMMDLDEYRDGFVKIIVHKKNSPYLFDRFLDELYDHGVSRVTIVEEQPQEIEEIDAVNMATDTLTIITNEIDGMEHVKDKNKLKALIGQLYNDAQYMDISG